MPIAKTELICQQIIKNHNKKNLKIACQWFLHTTNASGDLQTVGEEVREVLETSWENLLRCLFLFHILPEG